MEKIKYLYKITYSKTRENKELFLIISIVTAMIIVFTTMSSSISFAYQALAMKSESYDISVLDVSLETANEIKEEIESEVSVKYSAQKTQQLRFYFENREFFTDLIGAEGDYLEVYGENLIEGRLPEAENEILLDNKYIIQTGEAISVGTEIELYCDLDGYVSQDAQEFTVVGIVDSRMHDNIFDVNVYTTIETVEKILEQEDILYGYMMCAEGDSFEIIDYNYSKIYNIASAVLERSDQTGRIVMNEEKYMLYQDKSMTENSFGKTFQILAYVVGLISSFMIYNAISVSTNEKIRLYGTLQSLGLSKRGMFRNMLFNTVLSGLHGITLGCLFGFLLNHTVGKILMNAFNKGFGSSSLIKFDVVDRPIAYLQATGIVWGVLLLAQMVIVIQIRRFSVVDAIKYNGNSKVTRTGQKRSRQGIRNIIAYLGDRNLSRNKLQYFYTFLTISFSVTLLMSVTAFFGSMDIKDFDAFKKAGFCDYEFRCAENEAVITSEMIDGIKAQTNIKEVYGLRYSAWELFTEDAYTHERRLENVTDDAEIEKIMQEYIVAVFVAENAVLEEILEDEGIRGYDLSKPYVLINAVSGESGEIILYRNNEKIKIALNGTLNNNYLLDGQILCRVSLTMNEAAFHKYFQSPLTYTGILVTSDENQDVIVDEVREFLNAKGVDTYFKNCYEAIQDVKNQGVNLMVIAGYLMICILAMAIVNCVNIMRIIVKQRQKEFGILMTLGMSYRDLISLLSYEIRCLTLWAVSFAMLFSTLITVYATSVGGREIKWGTVLLIVIGTGILFYIGMCYVAKKIASGLIHKNIKANLEESDVSN